MSLSNWKLYSGAGAITSGVIIDTSTSGSGTRVMSITGALQWENISGGPATNCRVTCWLNAASLNEHHLFLRNSATGFNSTAYVAAFSPLNGGNALSTTLYRSLNGTLTTLQSNNGPQYGLADTRSKWIYLSFGLFNETGNVHYLVEYKNVSGVIGTALDGLDIGPTRITGSGLMRFGHMDPGVEGKWDDIQFFSLS